MKNVSPREGQPGLNLSVQIPEVLTEEGNRDWQLPKADPDDGRGDPFFR